MAGHSNIRPPAASENCFVADDDTAGAGVLDVPHEITFANNVVDFFLATTRYVGEVDGLGFLEHGNAAVKNGWLTPTMLLTIRFRITAVDAGGILGQDGVEVDLFLHRGMRGRQKSLGNLSGDFGSDWQEFKCEVDTLDVRFPDDPCPKQASSESCGLAPEPRSNKISFVFIGEARMTLEVDWITLATEEESDLAWHPVLLIHGYDGDASEMGPGTVWADGLTSREVGWYSADVTSRGAIRNNGPEVGAAVSDLRKRFGADYVDIVGFGKGGIDARDYVKGANDVETLIMLASPNSGSFIMEVLVGPYLATLPGTLGRFPHCIEMTANFMAWYNFLYTANPKTNYISICAEYDSEFANAVSVLYGPNDEVVSTASVTALPYAQSVTHKTSTTDEFSQGICATEGLTNHSCLRYNVRLFTTDVESLKPVPGQQLMAGQPVPSSLRTAPADSPDGNAGALQGVGSDAAAVPAEGAIQAHPVLIDSVDTAQFYVFAEDDVLSLQLVSPSGTRIDPTSPSTDPTVVHAPLLDAEFCWYTGYQIQDPDPGTWTLEVTGTTAPSSDGQYFVAAFAQPTSGLGASLNATLDRESYLVGDEVTITATVTSGSSPVTDATVTAQIVQPDEASATSVVLSSDPTAGDGEYRGVFVGTALPGFYPVVVSAEGTAPAFTRQQVLLVNVAPSATAFSGAVADHGVDTDGDGRYDQLVIDVEFEVDVAAEYRVFGTLTDGSGAAIEQVCPVQQLEPGLQTVSLLFDGARLFDLGLDGPYILDELVIEDVATQTGLARGPAYTTAAYSHDEFERPVCLLTGNASDHGVNTDPGNQLPYEELVIELEVDILVAADVQAVAQLYAEDGTFITTGRTYSSLTAGLNMLEFRLPAENIYRVGKAGPYNLQLFSMWEISTDETSVSLRAPGVVATTQPYALEDFGESDVFTVGGTVSGLVGEGLELTDVTTFLSVRPGNGPFSFSQPKPAGSAYDVRITAPATNPIQVTTITNAKGTVGSADVTDIAVDCVTPAPEAGLDLGFGDSGKVVAQYPGAAAVALQDGGKILLVGGLTLARLNADGSPDATFGSGGAVPVVLGTSSYTAAQSLAVQADGKIVVAGYTTTDPQGMHFVFALARYTSEGQPDPDFGGGAPVTTDFVGGYAQAYSVMARSDGTIVAAGLAAGEGPTPRAGFGAARYTATGALDETFGSGGKVTTAVADGPVTVAAAVLQPDTGKVVVTGPVFGASGGYEAFYLVRYTVDGAPDPDFGDGGLVRADFGLRLDHYPTALALQGGGEVVVAGWIGDAFAVARFDAAGHPDPGFGSGGLVTTPFDGYDARAQGVAIQSDGKIVLAGYTGDVSNEDFAVARYSSVGELDTDFGSGGKLTIDFFGDSDRAKCIAIPAEGKVLVAGSAWTGSMLGLVQILA